MRRLVSPIAAVLLLAGCSGLGPGAVGAPGTPTPPPVAGDLRPQVEITAESPPSELTTTDLVEGAGSRARSGDDVTVQYVLVAWSTGREIDASWDHERPYTFEIGAGQVIPGFERAVDGMRVGGRRRVVVPPALAYGDRGTPTLAPGETLVFVVDLFAVNGQTA